MKKKFFLIFIVFILLMGSIGLVSAQGKGVFTGITETLYNTVGDVFELISVTKLVSGGEDGKRAVFVAKFIMWIFLYAVLYYVAGFIFREHKSIRITVPMVIALMGVILIPEAVVLNIFTTYSVVAALLLSFLPVIGIWILAHKIPGEGAAHHAGRAILYIVLIYVLGEVNSSFNALITAKTISEDAIGNIQGYLMLLMGIVGIMIPIEIIRAFNMGGGARGIAGSAKDYLTGGKGGGVGGGGGVSPEDLEKRLAAMRNEQEEEATTGRELVKEEEIDDYIARAEAIVASLDTHMEALDNEELSLEERKNNVLNAAKESAAVVTDLERQLVLLEDKIQRGEVQDPEAVKAKVEQFRAAIERSRERVQQFAIEALRIIEQQERTVGEEMREEDQELNAAAGEEKAEGMEESYENAEEAQQEAVEKQAAATGQKQTAKAARKVEGATRNRKGKIRTQRNTSRKKRSKGGKAKGKEQRVRLELGEQKKLIERVVNLVNSTATQRLSSSIVQKNINDINACLTQLGKSEERLFKDEKQVKRLHEKMRKFDIKERKIESSKQSLIQKAHNALNEEKKKTGK